MSQAWLSSLLDPEKNSRLHVTLAHGTQLPSCGGWSKNIHCSLAGLAANPSTIKDGKHLSARTIHGPGPRALRSPDLGAASTNTAALLCSTAAAGGSGLTRPHSFTRFPPSTASQLWESQTRSPRGPPLTLHTRKSQVDDSFALVTARSSRQRQGADAPLSSRPGPGLHPLSCR